MIVGQPCWQILPIQTSKVPYLPLARDHYNLVNALAKPARTRILFRRSHYYYGFRFQRTIPQTLENLPIPARYPANILRKLLGGASGLRRY